MPQSYGAFSHLCASVAHESARAAPASRWRSFGLAAAHRPKAPSTCTQAPCAWATSMHAAKSSKAPALRSPRGEADDRGPVVQRGREPGRVDAPDGVGGRLLQRVDAEPEQAHRAVERAVVLRAGQHAQRWRAVQPAPLDVVAALRQQVAARHRAAPSRAASCVPVTNATDASAGRPSRSSSHAPATSSTIALAGEVA